jgi:hypothetical protein
MALVNFFTVATPRWQLRSEVSKIPLDLGPSRLRRTAEDRVVELLRTGVLALCYDGQAQCGNTRLSLTPRKELP